MLVKICGLTDPSSARQAVEAGADAIGVVSHAPSSRHVSEAMARKVIAAVRDAARSEDRQVDTVLVVRTVPIRDAIALARRLDVDVLQLHGSYSADDFRHAVHNFARVWRATSLAEFPDLRAGEFGEERLLLDGATPGSGSEWNVSGLPHARLGADWLLAGGLSPENVAARVREARPAGVDVSSGVEAAPGVKDPVRVRAFIAGAKEASSEGTL